MILWMSPEKLAQSATKISTDFLSQNGMVVVNEWHHGPHGIDLFIWRNGSGEILKFQLNLLGSITEWNIQSGIQTGMIIEEGQATGTEEFGPIFEKVFYDSSPVRSTLEYASLILSMMPELDPSEKKTLLQRVENDKSAPSALSILKKWLKFRS